MHKSTLLARPPLRAPLCPPVPVAPVYALCARMRNELNLGVVLAILRDGDCWLTRRYMSFGQEKLQHQSFPERQIGKARAFSSRYSNLRDVISGNVQ